MELGIHPVESSAHVVNFSVAVVVLAGAKSGAAKVEAQHRETKTVQRLHGMEHNFVMQSPTEERMRVTNYRCVSRILRPGVEECLQAPRGPIEEEGLDG